MLVWSLGCGETAPHESAEDGSFSAPDHAFPMPYDTLSAYDFFEHPMVNFTPKSGVIPYQVASPTWADHAEKARFVVVPRGHTITIETSGEWTFPDGTIVIKNFFYALDRRDMDASATPIETRLLIKEGDDWTGHTYVWNETLTEATRKIAGRRVHLNFLDEHGTPTEQEYVVPNTNQCKDCHEIERRNGLLGLVPRQIVRSVLRDGRVVDQVEWLASKLPFNGGRPEPHPSPLIDPFGDGSLNDRARSYLDANCSHCHRDGGNGGRTGLVLLASETNLTKVGVCKGPVAAGAGTGDRLQDIVPGFPEDSILVYRMQSADPEIKMPEIPNRLPHHAGVDLVSEWIRQMEPKGCP